MREYYDDYFTFFEERERSEYIRQLERENAILTASLHNHRKDEYGITKEENKRLKEEVTALRAQVRGLQRALRDLGLVLIDYRNGNGEVTR